MTMEVVANESFIKSEAAESWGFQGGKVLSLILLIYIQKLHAS